MSAEMASSTETIELYIPLLNEGTEVMRPTRGAVLGPHTAQVLPTADYDPAVEEWEFPPGTKVRYRTETIRGENFLIARQRVDS